MGIRFGTDGWRAVIADTFTFANLRLVAQAVADYVLAESSGTGEPEVVIGFDTRFLSDRFAAEVARVFAGNGIVAWLTRSATPTPAISYNVKARGAVAGVVITASHNPPRYSGFKLKARYGGSASPEQSRRVEGYLEEAQRSARGPNLMDFHKAVEAGLIRRFDPTWSYYEHLDRLVNLDLISSGELRVIADPMYGAGRGCFTDILSRTRCRVREIRGEMNPGFGGIHPEPIQRHLSALVAAVRSDQADVGIATDGDADRIGMIDANGNFVDPHHIFALALRYLTDRRGMAGDVVKTVSTTVMVDRIATEYGLTVHETPVGFNHIADLMLERDVLIGGEESGGMSIKGHVPEGDGILMGLLMLEMMSDAGVPLHEMVADLQSKYGPCYYRRLDLRLDAQHLGKEQMVARLVDLAPASINGERVIEVDTTDGVKYKLADDSWLLIRPSGTEPIMRVYAEAPSPEAVDGLLGYGRSIAAFE